MVLFSVRMILFEERDVSTSMVSASLVQSSMTLKVRNFLPLTVLSLIKSIDQLLFTITCCCKGCLTRAGNLRLPFLFLFNFSSLYTLYTFLWFQFLPARLR